MRNFVTFLICAVAVFGASGCSLLVLFANGMSDAPGARFKGLGLIAASWIIAGFIIAARVF